MLFDSNILIQAAQAPTPELIDMLAQEDSSTASIVRIEVYGFHKLNTQEKEALDKIFELLDQHDLTQSVAERAIIVRQQHKTKLADAIIAATALVHDLPLVTRNVEDFKNIEGLRLIDPFAG